MSCALAMCAVPSALDHPLVERAYPEPAHAYRSPFARDRARIIHARAFRRLAGKTQVFTHRATPAFSDHFRSRLTHTMEVAQIARTIAGALGLNGELVEALALVHDIGHPPFGHAGERALDRLLREHGLRFDHNLHALRIVEHFEHPYAGFRGLNLTLGVREGIIKHSRDYSPEECPELARYFLDQRPPLEAQLIDWADEIAYLTADFDDGMEAGLLEVEHLRAHMGLFERFYEPAARQWTDAAPKLIFNEALKGMLNALVSDLIEATCRAVEEAGVGSLDEVRRAPRRLVGFSAAMEAERVAAKRYLYDQLYGAETLKRDHTLAERVIENLFREWVREPGLLPGSHAREAREEGAPRVVADYIAGMTDAFILGLHEEWAMGRSVGSTPWG